MTGTEVAAIVGSCTTLLAGFGGVWVTQRFAVGRELREAKRSVYVRWIQFAENIGIWAFQPGAHFGDFLERLHNAKSELDLVGSRRITDAVQQYLDALDTVNEEIQRRVEELGPEVPPQQQVVVIGQVFRKLEPHRRHVLTAMKHDLGYE